MLHRRVFYFGTLRRTRAYPHGPCRVLHRCSLHGLFGARCMLHRRTLLVPCCILHPCMLHRCIGACWHVASARVVRCISSSCVLHRCALPVALPRVASVLDRRRKAAPQRLCSVVRCTVCCAFALLDWAKGGLCGGRAAVRCARAQNNGGVLSMTKGTALFDTVAISGTEAIVRAGRAGCAVGADVGGRGATADCNGRGCAGCAQRCGGVVLMDDGAVTFKGGSISNSTAVRATCAQRELHVPRRRGDPIGTRSAAQRRARAACAARCACARHTPRGEVSQRKDACIEAYYVPKPRSGPVPPRCMRYRMRRCGMRCACCTGVRCVLHRLRVASAHVASEQWIALDVASACLIGARCTLHRSVLHVALVRVACCTLHRCTLHRCIGACRMLHNGARGALHRCVLTCCIGVCCVLHRCALHAASVHVACCIRDAPPPRSALPCDMYGVCAARLGEGRAFAVAERRRDALVHRASGAACST
jgi:hypothetical protein